MTSSLILRLAGASAVALLGLFLGASHSIHLTNEHVGIAMALLAAGYAYRQIGRYFDTREGAEH